MGDNTEGVDRNILAPGTLLGEFEIDACIGSGGFGVTYKAEDTTLNRTVAIKEYFPFDLAYRDESQDVTPRTQTQADLDDFSWGLERVVVEAQALAMFEHPNIVRVLRYIESRGTAYIVMEFVPGQDLAEVLRDQGTLSVAETKALINPLMSGLKVVHRAEMLHRDIKPGNIRIRADGSPVLIDFGAARQAVSGKSKSLSAIVSHGYAPNEQYSPKGNQGPWTDIYALAAVAYTCLLGEPPQDATERVMEDEVTPLPEVFPDEPDQAFLEALDWALRPFPKERPQSVEEWASHFNADEAPVSEHPAQPAPRSGPATRRIKPNEAPSQPTGKEGRNLAVPIAAALVAICGLGGVGYLAMSLGNSDKEVAYEVVGGGDQKTPTAQTTASAPAPARQQSAPSSQTSAPSQPPPQTDNGSRERSPEPIRVDPQDIAAFSAAQAIGTRDAYRLYLMKYPDGQHAAQARAFLAR
ncbi:MAG: protein kinase [Pseudomonadota bacterium]